MNAPAIWALIATVENAFIPEVDRLEALEQLVCLGEVGYSALKMAAGRMQDPRFKYFIEEAMSRKRGEALSIHLYFICPNIREEWRMNVVVRRLRLEAIQLIDHHDILGFLVGTFARGIYEHIKARNEYDIYLVNLYLQALILLMLIPGSDIACEVLHAVRDQANHAEPTVYKLIMDTTNILFSD